jgi:Tol biopolymer transport system component
MELSAGTRLGPYEILAPLGAGGMGEVYRATDTKLNRDVAVKALPAEVAQDPERLARFRREAQLLASLNHTNIAAIYGLEEAGGKPFLALELVEGEDLKERLNRGAIPLDEALEIARQIVEALEEAHEKGIVHRDLKPANVKLTPDGKVKVLDFGLARAYAVDSASGSTPDLSQSPTLAHSATQAGVILGTAAYMSPEQARGRPLDKRADIWAFGVVLYEMFTGKQLFGGETVSDVLAAVLKTEPDWSALPTTMPGPILRLLRRCLERDPRTRLRDIGDARFELAATAEPDEGSHTAAPARFASRPAVALMATLGLAALALGLLHLRDTGSAGLRDVVRTSIALPHGHTLVAGPEITRDGQRIAFVSTDGLSRPQLYTRRLDEPELRRLDGTEEANQPFFSPDGRWIAFYARGGFFKVRVDGGEPVRLADASSGEGGHWLEDGTILFTRAWNSGLYRIDANGGEPEPFLIPDRESYYAYTWPFVLPGERAMLFNRWGAKPDLARLDLEDMSQSVVADGQWRRSIYTASGHIVFTAHGGDLLVLPGEGSAAVAATPETVLSNVAGGGDPDGYSRVSVSASGSLAFSPLDASQRSLVRVDSAGRLEPVPGPQANYAEVSVSPDGRRVAVTSDQRLFVHDLVRGSHLPLAPELPRDSWHGRWTPDGARIVFSAPHGGTWDVYSKAASGTGEVELVLGGPFDQHPTSVMRDGTVVVDENHDTTANDIWLLPLGGEPQPWLVTPAAEKMGRVSPDDRLLAFISNVSGRYEVYVQPVNRSSDAVPVSTKGGTGPVWSRSGDRLFFRQGRLLMRVPVVSQPRLEVGRPEVVFDAGWELGQGTAHSYYQFDYDVLPDGRFLMVKNDPEAIPTRINVIFNWFEELNRLVPATGR